MLHHRTTDPAVRTEHICHRLWNEMEVVVDCGDGIEVRQKYPGFEGWLRNFDEILKEMSHEVVFR